MKKLHKVKPKKLFSVLLITLLALVTGMTGMSYQSYAANILATARKSVVTNADIVQTTANRAIKKTKAAIKAKKEAAKRARQKRFTDALSKAKQMKYVSSRGLTPSEIQKSPEYRAVQKAFSWNGPTISRSRGAIAGGPNGGRETYYNLNMSTCVSIMHAMGYQGIYWVRSDGCKMFGNYIMVAANLSRSPKGTIVKCSLGYAIVVDTGGFASANPTQLDVATNW